MAYFRGARALVVLSVLALVVSISPALAGADQEMLKVTKGCAVSLDVDGKPLSEILRMMAEKRLFSMAGRPAPGEPVTFHFSNLTLSQALSKVMQGYNYVLVDEGKDRPPVLNVMGKAERPAGSTQGPANAAPPKPGPPPNVATAAPHPPGRQETRSYVPPAPPQPVAAPPQAMQPRQPLTAPPQTPANGQPPVARQPAAPRTPPVMQQPALAGVPAANTPGGQQPVQAGGQPKAEEQQGVHF